MEESEGEDGERKEESGNGEEEEIEEMEIISTSEKIKLLFCV